MLNIEIIILFIFTVFTSKAITVKTPPFIHPCETASDSCITEAVRDAVSDFTLGIPELGVSPLDPFFVDVIDLVLPGGLKVYLTNGTFSGMRKCIIEKATLHGTTFDLRTKCNITIKGKYRANGRILLFPINGNGDAKIRVSNVRFHVRVFTKNLKGSDGEYHVVIQNYDTKYEWGDKIAFHLSNLFDGNPQISSTVLAFLNENWRVVAEEFGQPLVDVAVKRIISNIKRFFAALPYKDIIRTPLILD